MADDTNQTSEKPTPPAVRPRPKPAAGVAGRKPRPKAPPEPPKGPPDPAPPEGTEPPAYVAALQAGVAGAVSQVTYWVGDWSVIVPADRLLEVARFLRERSAGADSTICADVTATDWPPREQRFDVIYCLYSTLNRHRLRREGARGGRRSGAVRYRVMAGGELARARGSTISSASTSSTIRTCGGS